jgi:hypothetical protein
LIQLLLNGTFGIIIGTGLWLIGVPSAILWGILAAVLRFVPYIGAAIAAAFPLVLAVAVDPTWSMLLWTLTLPSQAGFVSNFSGSVAPGWRRSADRTRLRRNSLLTGNFTGNFEFFGPP